MAGNKVEQKVSLDAKQYRSELAKLRAETASAFGGVEKVLFQAGGAFNDFQVKVAKIMVSMADSAKKTGLEVAKYFGKGAALGGLAAGAELIHSQMKQAASTGLEFGKSLASLASRANLSKDRVKQLRDELYKLGETGASLESLPDAVAQLYGMTGNMDTAVAMANPIAKGAAMGNGNAAEMSEFVGQHLKGEDKDLNAANADALIQSLLKTQRAGGYKDMSEAMTAFNSVSGGDLKRAGISDNKFAGILAGSSRVGEDKETSLAAASALVHAQQASFGGSAALAGMLGMKGGRFDFNQIGQGASNFNKRYGKMSESNQIGILTATGLSEKESAGLLAILKNVKNFQKGIDDVASDTKSTDQAFDESTDNLSDSLKKMRNGMDKGFDQIFSPFEGVLNKAVKGDFGGAAAATPGALMESVHGMSENKGLVASSVALTALTGAIGSKFGLMGEAMKGQAVSKVTGVPSVYVINAQEIGLAARGINLPKLEEVVKDVGAIPGMGKIAKAAKYAKGAAAFAGEAALPVAVGYGAGKVMQHEAEIEEAINNVFKKKEAASTGKVIMPADSPIRVQVEVDSKDPAYSAKPKSTDNARDPRKP